MNLRIIHVAAVLSILAGLVAPAAANPVVLAVNGKDVYIDLGAHDGVGAGTDLELLHEVVVRDPRTGAMLRDHFARGTLVVVKSGERVSLARVNDDLDRVLVGDRIRVLSAKRTFVDPWAQQVAAQQPPPEVVTARPRGPANQASTTPATPKPGASITHPPQVDHATLVGAALEDTLGKPPEERVTRWLKFLGDAPKTTYTEAVQREIATLRAQIKARDAALAKQRSTRSEDLAPRVAALAAQLDASGGFAALLVGPVHRAEPGRPIDLSFVIRDPSQVARAWLYVRAPGAPGFERQELTFHGDAYLRGRIAEALVRAPNVQWYVEVAAAAGAAPQPVIGSPGAPRSIDVQHSIIDEPIASGRSHIDAHVDYVDFDGDLGNGFDQYYQAEIDFTYRFLEPVYAVRLGFGSLSGIGGPKDVIDDSPEDCVDTEGIYRCARVSFSYIYTEVELRVRENVAIMLRPQAGLLTRDTLAGEGSANRCSDARELDKCSFFTGFGGRARLRLGNEAETSLVIGAGFTDGVGTVLEAAYQWRPLRVMPVQLSINVTDQPINEDLGVRLIADVGWRGLSWFYPSARVSYQARDIDHAGVSGGVAFNFDW